MADKTALMRVCLAPTGPWDSPNLTHRAGAPLTKAPMTMTAQWAAFKTRRLVVGLTHCRAGPRAVLRWDTIAEMDFY